MPIECAVCSGNIGRFDYYLECRTKCKQYHHIKCIQVSEEQFMEMKKSGEIKTWECNDCINVLTSNQSLPGESSIENIILNKISQEMQHMLKTLTKTFKNEIFKLQNENQILLEELNSIKQYLKIQKSSETSVKLHADGSGHENVNISTVSGREDKPVTQANKFPTKYTDTSISNVSRLNAATIRSTYSPKAQTNTVTAKNKFLLNNSDSTNKLSANENDFITVTRSNRRKSVLNITKGTATDTVLKGIAQYAHLHVCGLEPGTTEDAVKAYLSSKDIKDSKCEKMEAKRPLEYASFKISIPIDLLEQAKKPEIWPTGVKVNRFLARIYKKKEEK